MAAVLNRSAYQRLLDWKENGENKALLVDGARQIGKTFLIEQFAANEFDDWVKIDFLRDEEARSLASARSLRDVLERLSLIVGRQVVPERTLLFFDEVQEAQNLVTLAKYLVIDGHFRLVMTGSLLGVSLSRVHSFPVGYLQVLHMFPLDFTEFALAQGASASLLTRIQEHFETSQPIEPQLHEQLTQTFRRFIVVGGMPEAVSTYLDTQGNLASVRERQSSLVELYRDDIAKHAGKRNLQVKAIYDAIGTQLDKENKRFELKNLGDRAVFERYSNDFAWLVSAGAALKANAVAEPKYPLMRTDERNRFKLYQSDTGMLISQYPGRMALGTLAGDESLNRGGIYENIVAQELASARVPLRYFRRNKIGEVDFLAESVAGAIVPIEVKSGKGYKRHVALNNLLASSEFDIPQAFVVSEGNLHTEQRGGKTVRYIPLYMVPFLCSILGSHDADIREEARLLGLGDEAHLVRPIDLSGE